MDTLIAVLAWALWALVLLFGLGTIASRNTDGGMRFMARTQGAVLLLACITVLVLPISKFWLLAALPVAFFLPLFLMGRRAANMKSQFAALQRESEATGVPITDLLKRETERMKSGR